MIGADQAVLIDMFNDLVRFCNLHASFTQAGWEELCDAMFEGEPEIPTWNEIIAFCENLEDVTIKLTKKGD